MWLWTQYFPVLDYCIVYHLHSTLSLTPHLNNRAFSFYNDWQKQRQTQAHVQTHIVRPTHRRSDTNPQAGERVKQVLNGRLWWCICNKYQIKFVSYVREKTDKCKKPALTRRLWPMLAMFFWPWPSERKINGFPGLLVEHLYVKFGASVLFRYRSDQQTQMLVNTLARDCHRRG